MNRDLADTGSSTESRLTCVLNIQVAIFFPNEWLPRFAARPRPMAKKRPADGRGEAVDPVFTLTRASIQRGPGILTSSSAF